MIKESISMKKFITATKKIQINRSIGYYGLKFPQTIRLRLLLLSDEDWTNLVLSACVYSIPQLNVEFLWFPCIPVPDMSTWLPEAESTRLIKGPSIRPSTVGHAPTMVCCRLWVPNIYDYFIQVDIVPAGGSKEVQLPGWTSFFPRDLSLRQKDGLPPMLRRWHQKKIGEKYYIRHPPSPPCF